MKSYLESILIDTDTQSSIITANDYNNNKNINRIRGGSGNITIICMLDSTINIKLTSYLEKKRVNSVDIRTLLPGLVVEAYNELENRYYSAKEIMQIVSQKVITSIENKSKSANVFILPLNKPILNTKLLFDGLEKKMKVNLYFLNLDAELLFETFYENNDFLQVFQPVQSLLNWIAVYYKKASTKTEKTIHLSRKSLKKYLLQKKYFFSSEEKIDENVNELFSFFEEPGEELYLEFNSPPGIDMVFININVSTNINQCLNKIPLT